MEFFSLELLILKSNFILMSTQQNVINQIKQDFLTNDNQVINKALSITRAKGNKQLILPLIELYKSTQEEGIKKEIKSIFSELKKKNVLDILLPELDNGNNEVKELILFLFGVRQLI